MFSSFIDVERGVLALVATLFIAPGTYAAGLMTPANDSLSELQIRQHHVDVVIEDGYAITTVNQVFSNPHNQVLEAIYSFPVPEQASVGEFTYWIDGQPVTGEVLKKQEARQVYEQEKAQGRETALTEKIGYLSFDSSVYPVRPQGEVKIRLVYIQPVHATLGVGRYVYPLEEGGVDEEKLAFWSYNDVVEEAFSFNMHMRSSYPIDEFRLPQHSQAQIVQESSQEWRVSINKDASATEVSEESIGAATSASPAFQMDKDIAVYWRHQKGLPGSVDMIAHKPAGSDRGTFMMTLTPGDDLSSISSGRDWVFVLDFSGSMQGKYHSLVEGVNKGLGKLKSNDRFRIVLFSQNSRELTNGYQQVNAENIMQYTQELENLSPSGGTNLYAGLEQGYRNLDSDRPSAIILVTDGVANLGRTEKKDFLELLKRHDVRLFSFVMGNSANRPLLNGMAKVSNGTAMSISNSDDITGRLIQTADMLSHQAYRDIAINIDGVKVRDISPAHIGSLYRGQQLIIFGHYWGHGPAQVSIKGKVSAENRTYRTGFDFPEKSTLHPEIERMWAFASIEELQNRIDYLGEDSDSEQAIIDLALEYDLVTDYTSMVVVREQVFGQYNIARKNKARVEQEHNARQQRVGQPVRDNRRDTQQPTFSNNRAYPKNNGGSGAGALDLWGLLLLLPLLLLNRRKYQ